MSDKLLVNVKDGIAQVLFNRPEVYNAMDSDVIEAMASHFTALATDPAAKVVVLSGVGKAFSSGADLKKVALSPVGIPAAIYRLAGVLHQAVTEIRHMPKPVIAAINGIAAGAGFSTALAADFRVMAKSATLRQVYTSWGLCIDGGGTFALPRLAGQARALEIAAFDKPISAEQALAWGLVTRVVEDGQALDEAMAMARELMDRSLHSFGKVKDLITSAYETPLEVQLERERHALTACVQHPDAAEGVRAFLEKRKPIFNKT
jgi:2-(1,2-epoxy-1,2-dihydrophenyl)acetyl-CoA isomerase